MAPLEGSKIRTTKQWGTKCMIFVDLLAFLKRFLEDYCKTFEYERFT
jgi:hypothetical protein